MRQSHPVTQERKSQEQYDTPAIPALRKLRQEDHRLVAILSYTKRDWKKGEDRGEEEEERRDERKQCWRSMEKVPQVLSEASLKTERAEESLHVGTHKSSWSHVGSPEHAWANSLSHLWTVGHYLRIVMGSLDSRQSHRGAEGDCTQP